MVEGLRRRGYTVTKDGQPAADNGAARARRFLEHQALAQHSADAMRFQPPHTGGLLGNPRPNLPIRPNTVSIPKKPDAVPQAPRTVCARRAVDPTELVPPGIAAVRRSLAVTLAEAMIEADAVDFELIRKPFSTLIEARATVIPLEKKP